MRAPDSICATSSGARSARSASCSALMLRDSRMERTFSPREFLSAMASPPGLFRTDSAEDQGNECPASAAPIPAAGKSAARCRT